MAVIVPNMNQQTGVPIEHYKQLFAEKDPKLMAQTSGIPYDGEKFSLKLLNRVVNVYWPDMKVVFQDEDQELGAYTVILVSRLIMEGSVIPTLGKMKSYAEMPWGEVYIKQFTGRCINRMAFSYGKDIGSFRQCCEALGAEKLNFGDASYDFAFISTDKEKLTVRATIWEADDEFPPAAQILFSDNFPSAFKAEDIAVVGDILINAMKGKW